MLNRKNMLFSKNCISFVIQGRNHYLLNCLKKNTSFPLFSTLNWLRNFPNFGVMIPDIAFRFTHDFNLKPRVPVVKE